MLKILSHFANPVDPRRSQRRDRTVTEPSRRVAVIDRDREFVTRERERDREESVMMRDRVKIRDP